jgi:hypothetical protein
MFIQLQSNVCNTVSGVFGNGPSASYTVGSQDSCWLAERAIADIELTIGGQRIDKHYQRWWRLYSELYLTEAKKANWGKMTSDCSGGAQKVMLPLIFFFNRNPGLYLPLIALQYHEVRIDFDLADNFGAYLSTSAFKVWGNYVYLDTEERRRFAQKGHEYLIEQVQSTGTDTATSAGTKQIRLSYNHPVKELVWCLSGTDSSNNQLWNFTSNATVSNAVVLSSDPALATLISNCAVPIAYGTGSPVLLFGNGVFGSTQSWVEDGTTGADNSYGPLSSFKLILNGQDRFKEQSGKYFNQVQPYFHHTGCPYPGVYAYSFALKPEEHQPTGTCNFSRIDNAQAEVTLKVVPNNTTLNMFAVNYNVLRIQSGMGGLAFSN